ncbi:MAG: hypothetical protein HQ567_31350 [Candidatus Nealsonbacteria bacterium]|nr:hypothetical protein [Candidatus Nealsonbacteria bacterium]
MSLPDQQMSFPDLGELARQLNPQELQTLAGYLKQRAKLTEKAAAQLTKLAREMEKMDAEIASFLSGNRPDATATPCRAARGKLSEALREILRGKNKKQALSLKEVKKEVKKRGLPVSSVSAYLSRYSTNTGDHRWHGYKDPSR